MITVVVGPPCAGKSTFVRENAKPNDAVVDFDSLATAFGSGAAHDTPQPLRRVVQAARRAAVSQILLGVVETAWVIDTDPGHFMLQQYRRAGATIEVIDPGMEVCIERALADERPEWTADQIRRWYRLNKKATRA
ncbi:hypothetical protein [Rhodococcus sp. SORGH_AS_0303]|uniref:hypothetical protein n=1 Tax=Rhodococcus sp. SORGH_AS_0303 TaxID=3041753 RepID=UPI002782A7E9|nr:hypothetical protein [Rhodococcus sp. SORGH_AS_0303]MDQ1202840.1 putative ABC-type ATPase [Rhodococcus sp. SORGH_AS_0303]